MFKSRDELNGFIVKEKSKNNSFKKQTLNIDKNNKIIKKNNKFCGGTSVNRYYFASFYNFDFFYDFFKKKRF